MNPLLHTSRMAILWLFFTMCLLANLWAQATPTEKKNIYIVYDQSKSFKDILNKNDSLFFKKVDSTLKNVYNNDQYKIIYHTYGESLYLDKLNTNTKIDFDVKEFKKSKLNIDSTNNNQLLIQYNKTLPKNTKNPIINKTQIVNPLTALPPINFKDKTICLYKNLLLALDGITIKEKDKSNFKVIIVSDGLITNPIEGEEYKAKVTAALRNLEVMTNTNVFAIHINRDTTNHYFNFNSSEFNSRDSFIKESSNKLWISNSKFTDKKLINTVIPSLVNFLRKVKFMAHESVLIPNKNNDAVINYLNYLYVKNAIRDTITPKQSDSFVNNYLKNLIYLKNKIALKSDDNIFQISNTNDSIDAIIKKHQNKLNTLPQIALALTINNKHLDSIKTISDTLLIKHFYDSKLDSFFAFKDLNIFDSAYNILNDSTSILSYKGNGNEKFNTFFYNIPQLIEEDNAVGKLAYKYLDNNVLDSILKNRIVDYNLPTKQIDYQVKFLSQFMEQKNHMDKKIDVMINPRIVQKASSNLEENIILGLTSYIIDRSKNEIIFSLIENINELFHSEIQLQQYFQHTHSAINDKKVKDVNDLKKFITLDYAHVWTNLIQDSLIENKEILPTISFIEGFSKAIKKNEGNIFASFNTMAQNWNIKDRLTSVIANSTAENNSNTLISYKNVNQFIEQDFKFYLLANILGTNSQFDLFKLNDQNIDDVKSFTTLFINNTINKYKSLLTKYDDNISKYSEVKDLINLNNFANIIEQKDKYNQEKYINIKFGSDTSTLNYIKIDAKSNMYNALMNLKSDNENHFYVLTSISDSVFKTKKNNKYYIYKYAPKHEKTNKNDSLILLEYKDNLKKKIKENNLIDSIAYKYNLIDSVKIFYSLRTEKDSTSKLIRVNKNDDNFYSLDTPNDIKSTVSKIIAFTLRNIDRKISLANYYKEINEEVYHIKNKLVRLEAKRKEIKDLKYDDLQKIDTEFGKELRNVWANLIRLGVNKSLVTSNYFSSTKINSVTHKNMVNIIDLWEDINNSDYDAAINNIIPILRNNIRIKANDDLLKPKLQKRIDLFFNIAAEIPSCRSSEEIKQIITKYTLPVASYKAKKEYNTIMITAYPGVNYIHKLEIDGIKNDIVLSIPIGIEYSFLAKKKTNNNYLGHYKYNRNLNFSVMLSLIDLGNVLPYYFNQPNKKNGTPSDDYTLSFENLYSPGLLFNFGFTKRIPLNLQVGYMFNPQRFSAGLSLDLPLFGIWKN